MDFANPFRDVEGRWFRGNVHTHTTESDGRLSPIEVADFYSTRGYDFLVLTDHEKVSDPASLSRDGFLVFTGLETSPLEHHHHLVGIGTDEIGPFSKRETAQDSIDALRDMGAYVFLAHPYWSALTESDILGLKGIDGVELYNTGCEVEKGRGFSTVHWDNLLSSGMKLNGLAVDDAHRYTDDAPGGWIWVRARELTELAIMDSVRNGYFYASTGPRILDVRIEDDTMYVLTSPCTTITFHSKGPTGSSNSRVGEGMLCHAQHTFRPEHEYVRLECVDGGGRRAWTSPMYTDEFGT